MTPSAILRFPAVSLLALALAGCSGGGMSVSPDGTTGALANPVDKEGLDALGQEFDYLVQRFYMAPVAPVPPLDTGTATFNGIAMFKPTEEDFKIDHDAVPEGGDHGPGGYGDGYSTPDLVADMAMTVDFATNGVTGSMWDFHDGEGTEAGGSVELTGEHDFHHISGTGQGTLDWGDHHQELDIAFDGVVIAQDYGVRGGMDLTSTIGDETTSSFGKFYVLNDQNPDQFEP